MKFWLLSLIMSMALIAPAMAEEKNSAQETTVVETESVQPDGEDEVFLEMKRADAPVEKNKTINKSSDQGDE